MKKSDLVKIIREIVRQEIKKELPTALAHLFANMAGDNRPAVHSMNMVRYIDTPKPQLRGQEVQHEPSQEEVPEIAEELEQTALLREQLRDIFSEGEPVRRATAPQQRPQTQYAPPLKKQFTKNPVLNDILNQTRPFNSQERKAMGVGGSGMSPSVMMAAASSGYAPQAQMTATTGPGQMMESEELRFLSKIPGMPGADAPFVTEAPAPSQMRAPVAMPDSGEISALDLKNHPALPENLRNVLTRDYRSLVRAMDKKK